MRKRPVRRWRDHPRDNRRQGAAVARARRRRDDNRGPRRAPGAARRVPEPRCALREAARTVHGHRHASERLLRRSECTRARPLRGSLSGGGDGADRRARRADGAGASARDETRARRADRNRRPQSRAEASVARVLLVAQGRQRATGRRWRLLICVGICDSVSIDRSAPGRELPGSRCWRWLQRCGDRLASLRRRPRGAKRE